MADPHRDRDGRGWLEVLGLHRPELRAWSMYDWALSGWQTVILTALFPVYYYGVAGAALPPGVATERFATATALSVALVALVSPLLGAIADRLAIRKRMLAACLALGVPATAGFGLVGPGDATLATVLFVLAYLGASASIVFYDALLPHVARIEEIDRVSSMGHALGYLGGAVLLALDLLVIARPAWFGLPPDETTWPARVAFLSVAVWWLAFSVPLFRKVSEPAAVGPVSTRRGAALVSEAFAGLTASIRSLLRLRQAAWMLTAFVIYQAGVETIQKMATIFGKEVGLDDLALLATILMVQILGIPFAILFGILAGRIGAKPSILIALAVYVVASVLGSFLSSLFQFMMVAGLIAMVRGGCQALSRSLFARLVPAHESATAFGLFAVAEKLAGALGPGFFAFTIASTGSSRRAVGALVAFFVVGGVMLARVNVPSGHETAAAAEPGLAS